MVSTPPLRGGRPALDFVNSVHPRVPAGRDYLGDVEDLILWARHAGLVDAEWQKAASRVSPRTARAAFRRLIALRELLYTALAATAEGRTPTTAVRREVAQAADEVRRRETFGWSDDAWAWRPRTSDPFRRLERLIVDDALDLLARPERLRKCEGEPCGWLFLDTTKNHSKRWCSMAGCGNRAKARRFQERQRRRNPVPH